ncbi:SDR family oxidoreductase [Neomegalonema sp.]|uniref:SDR family oxidoreductase n=1 Tax=Neomegalonema sp. TaxID=2039713 RepID=UPI00262CE3C4|nr:SDR family oxidoreductase [Neomegalonema sp.]MDD2868746.1 SDR family oxidoreductase [Neomegalonema sp.]
MNASPQTTPRTTIAVTGASGQLGRLILQDLRKAAPEAEIVGLLRDPGKALDLAAQGVVLRKADYEDPASLNAALRGVDRLALVSSNEIGKRFAQHANVIAAAKAAGVRLVVYTSLLHAPVSGLSLAPEHIQTEEALKASGLPHVILRNGWYTENYSDAIRQASQTGEFAGAADEGRIASASRADFALAAAQALLGAARPGETLELAGDRAWTLGDLAVEIARVRGGPVVYKNLPVPQYAALLKAFGLPEAVADMLAGWEGEIAKGALDDKGDALRRLTGRPSTSLAQTVEELLKV